MRRFFLALAVMTGSGLFAEQGNGAVRMCLPVVVSQRSSADDEMGAKKAALDDWTKRAEAAGMEVPSWRTANSKSLSCQQVANGKFECVAAGEPCTIRQVAPDGPRAKKDPGI